MSVGVPSPGRSAFHLRRPPRPFIENWGVGLLAVLVAPLLLAAFVQAQVTAVSSVDVGLYRWWGDLIAHGAVPFRDVRIEYPPAAVPFFVLPALVTSSRLGYAIAFAAVVGALGMAGLLLAARIGTMIAGASRDWVFRTVAAAVMIGLLGAVALTRFDFVPAALMVAALYLLVAERFHWGGALLGAAVAVKLYPAVIVPVAAMYVLRRRGRRSLAIFLGLVIIVVLATYVPFVLIATQGVQDSIAVQAQRPLQIESSGASLLWLAREIGMARWPEQFGYYTLDFLAADIVATGSAIVGIVVLAVLWFKHAIGPAETTRLVRYSFACVAAFVVFAKVLSPQYLIWLVILVPGLRGSRANLVVGLLALAVIATAVYFPRWYFEAGVNLEPHWLGLIAIRNLLLAALLAVLIWQEEGPIKSPIHVWERGFRGHDLGERGKKA
jgi:uncharacterized membrane protein